MTEGFPKLIRTQRILELTLGCIGHLHGLVEESKGWGLWDPHDPPRLRDRPEACMGRPCILSESPSPGVSDPSCLLLQLCSVSSTLEASSPQAQKARSHPRPRSTLDPLSLQKLDLLVDSDSGLWCVVPTISQMALAG